MDIDKRYKNILLETFKAFDNFCTSNNIKYYAAYGTAIGAIRHHGLIPWDDDIDVWMLRKDYDNFIKLRKNISDGFELLNVTDEGYYLAYAKFCHKNSSVWEKVQLPYVMGVFIDIFPLDEVDANDKDAINVVKDCKKATQRLKGSLSHYPISRLISLLIGGHFGELRRNLRDILFYSHKNTNKYREDVIKWQEIIKAIKGDSLMVYNSFYPIQKETYKKDWFNSFVRISFEDTTIPLPSGYDSLLKQIYGDYMTPPTINKRHSTHGHYFINLTKRMSVSEIKHFLEEQSNRF